jgi:hypothetical protein
MRNSLKIILFSFVLILPTGCLKQGKVPKIPGVAGPKVNVLDGKILLSVGLEKIDIPAGVTLPIPKLPNSDITIGPRWDGGTLIQIVFDPSDIKSEYFSVVPREVLPDGRPFPFLAGGELPALAINVPAAFDMTFYGSRKLFGFFIPVKLPKEFYADIHYRIKINGKNIGVVSLIHPNDRGEGSGFVLLLSMEQITQNEEIVDFLEFSKKHDKTVF